MKDSGRAIRLDTLLCGEDPAPELLARLRAIPARAPRPRFLRRSTAVVGLAAGLSIVAVLVLGRGRGVDPESPSPTPVRAAAPALRILRAPPPPAREVSVAQLLRVARGPREEEATAAVSALAARPEAESVPALAVLLDDRCVRGPAARALARRDSPEAARALLAHLRHPEVEEAFAEAGPNIEAVLIGRLAAGIARDRLAAVRLLGRCGGPAAVAALEPLALDSALAPGVLRSLASIGGPEAAAALVRLSTSPRLRREAAPYLAILGREPVARAAPVPKGRSHSTLF